VLAIGTVVHWRPHPTTYDRYGLCKPAIVLAQTDSTGNNLALAVLGTHDGPVLYADIVPTGTSGGQWHFISNCPYGFNLRQPNLAALESNGAVHVQTVEVASV